MNQTPIENSLSPVITAESVLQKLKLVESEVHNLLFSDGDPNTDVICVRATPSQMPLRPGRDISFQESNRWPSKSGLQSASGQARLLHDLANIELQAVELGLRTLHEFSSAPLTFREELARITLEEASHLELCLNGLDDLGHKWGDWSIQTSLWDATSSDDSIIDRILIVHCYLEGSGLDAGDILLNRLGGVANKKLGAIVKKIVHDEIGHVDFGRRWFHHFCAAEGLDARTHLPRRLSELAEQIPARGAKVSRDLRTRAGYEADEITAFEEFQELRVKATRAPTAAKSLC